MTEIDQKKCLELSNIKVSRDRRKFVHAFHALHAFHVYASHYIAMHLYNKKNFKKKYTGKEMNTQGKKMKKESTEERQQSNNLWIQ